MLTRLTGEQTSILAESRLKQEMFKVSNKNLLTRQLPDLDWCP